MSTIPPDVERLMWTIAETGNTQAAADFEMRFPQHRQELAKRINLIESLKGAKSFHVGASLRPAFQPVLIKGITLAKAATVGGIVLATGALAVAGYVGAGCLFGSRVQELPAPPTVRVHHLEYSHSSGVKYRAPSISSQNPAPTSEEMEKTDDYPPRGVRPRDGLEHPFPFYGDVSPLTDHRSRNPNKPDDMELHGVALYDAVKMLANQNNLKVQFAPDMPNPVIDAYYSQKKTLDILADLGNKYGFGVVQEGENRILLVPTTPPSRG